MNRANFFGVNTGCEAGTFTTWDTLTADDTARNTAVNTSQVLFEVATHDCRGNLITGPTAGQWFRPIVPFHSKENSIYHMPANSLQDAQVAEDYCKGLGYLKIIFVIFTYCK